MQVDDHLIKRCIEGDQRAHKKLFEICFPYLYSLCLRYTNTVEDAKYQINECFFKILINLEKRKAEVPFKSWLRLVAVNLLINHYHQSKTKNNRLETEHTDQLENLSSGVQGEAEQKMNADEILSLLQYVPEISRRVFNLYAIEGYKHNEIAEMLQFTSGTSRWHLNNARTILKEKLNIKIQTA